MQLHCACVCRLQKEYHIQINTGSKCSVCNNEHNSDDDNGSVVLLECLDTVVWMVGSIKPALVMCSGSVSDQLNNSNGQT